LTAKDTNRSDTDRWAVFGAVSASLAVSTGLVYSLGVVSLLLPLMVAYGNDFATAWYAVSLISTAAIAGYGVRALALPLSLVAIILLNALSLNFVVTVRNSRGRLARLAFVLVLVILVAQMVGTGYLSYKAANLILDINTSVSSVLRIVLFTLAVVFQAIGTTLLTLHAGAAVEEIGQHWLWRVVSWRSLFRGLGFYVAFVFVTALLILIPSYPPLPRVMVVVEEGPPTIAVEEGPQVLDSTLVTQNSGYWYVFDKYCTLRAIDTSVVTTVEFSTQDSSTLACAS
jgi:hypothetical protein